MGLEALWTVVRRIPEGRVASYGAIGRALPNPTTGRIVGRWMAQCPDDFPWWRVVAKSGVLPVGKRDPRLAWEQRDRLQQEGVQFDGDLVSPESFWEP